VILVPALALGKPQELVCKLHALLCMHWVLRATGDSDLERNVTAIYSK